MPKQSHRKVLRSHSPSLCLLLTIISIFSTALLAPSQVQAQHPAGATDASAQAVQAPQDPLRAQAAAALDKQDYPAALKLLTALAEKNPTDAHVLYDLASTQDALDQTTTAEATYRSAIAADPAFFDPHLALGLLLARNGKLAEARTEFAAAVTLKTDNQPLMARAYRALARLDQSSRPSDASAELLSALKLSPETPDDILLSGDIAASSNDLPAAEAAYRRLLTSDPRNAAANAALAHVLLREHKPADAETALTAALSKNPDDPTLNAQLASLYEQQNQPENALPIVEKLHAAHPADSNL
ncbi:MAG: tetratricopeptide repeat protein, partial [Acidimicrobiales bacterium]